MPQTPTLDQIEEFVDAIPIANRPAYRKIVKQECTQILAEITDLYGRYSLLLCTLEFLPTATSETTKKPIEELQY